MRNINIHVYPSDMKHESRILRETKFISELNIVNSIIIIGIHKDDLDEYTQIDDAIRIWRVVLRTRLLPNNIIGKIIKYTEWILKIFIKFKSQSVAFVNCHSLSSLPIGILFKIFFGSKIIYDTHELETETQGMTGLKKILAKILEKFLINYTNRVIVVSESIAKWYKKQYNLKNVYIIKNIPCSKNALDRKSNIFKKKFHIKNDEILFIYQGMLSNGRGINLLLNAFSKVEKNKHIVFMGYGEFKEDIEKYVKHFSNIHIQSPVNPEKILNYTKSADVGISIIENICLSYLYCLPNKLFEYIQSGLPTIVSNFPDMSLIIDNYGCGWKTSVNEKSIINTIKNISKKDLLKKRNKARKCRNILTWQNESKKLLKIYKNLTLPKS